MKCFKGFNAVFDKDLKQMVPYFTKVRSSDIVPNAEIDIEQATTLTSLRWIMDRCDNKVDETVYKMIGEWDSKYDLSGEDVGTDFCRADLNYHIYKDGRLKIHGTLRLSCTTTNNVTVGSKSGTNREYHVYLPISFVEDSPRITVGWAHGTWVPSIMLARVDKAPIKNYKLNPSANAETYRFLLKINFIDLVEKEGYSDLFTLLRSADSEFVTEGGGETATEYMNQYFPFTIDYDGWWKPLGSMTVDAPKKFDNEVIGNYKTKGYTPMLTKPDMSGKVVRQLLPLIIVKCNGYFNENGGKKWLLCDLPGTLDSGYIPEDMLNYYA